MSRLIDADALIEVLKREEKENDEYGLTQRADGITDAIMDVIDAPTIEPQRMRGKWVGGELGHCSVCGHEGNASDIWNGCKGMFCPNCGAEMRGTE